MSDHFNDWTAPTGRRLEEPGDDRLVGSVSSRQSATVERVEMARRYLREIAAADLTRNGRGWVDQSTGDAYEAVRGHVDLANPQSTDATAFAVLDGLDRAPAGGDGGEGRVPASQLDESGEGEQDMSRNNIVSLGAGWYEAPREWWGTQDWQRFNSDQRYQPLNPGPVVTPGPKLPPGFGLHDDGRARDRSRDADRVLKEWGVRT
jgi:hypothetical protein